MIDINPEDIVSFEVEAWLPTPADIADHWEPQDLPYPLVLVGHNVFQYHCAVGTGDFNVTVEYEKVLTPDDGADPSRDALKPFAKPLTGTIRAITVRGTHPRAATFAGQKFSNGGQFRFGGRAGGIVTRFNYEGKALPQLAGT
jgi:hypothetical protein